MNHANPNNHSRRTLAQMSILAGTTNYSNPQEVEKIYRFGVDVFGILTMGGTHEQTSAGYSMWSPGRLENDVDKYGQIHEAQDKLEELLAMMYFKSESGQDVVGDAAEFYLALTEFHSRIVEPMPK